MNTSDPQRQGKEDQALEELFQQVPARQRAPVEVEQEIRASLHGEWSEMTRQRRRRRSFAGWAVAASVLLASLLSVSLLRQPGTATADLQLASVDKKTGDVFIQQAGENASRLLNTTQLFAGQELSTIQGSRVALNWKGRESVRLDHNSRIALDSEYEITLLSGRIYVDSNRPADQPPTPTETNSMPPGSLTINTPAGPVSHLGTQYMTGINGTKVEISVREGRVSIGRGDNSVIAESGQQVSVSSDGRHLLTAVVAYGDTWQWTEALAPAFKMDGRSLHDFLDWVGHETGRKIRYRSMQAQHAAEQTELHGSIDLEPLRALELVLQTSDLVSEFQNDVIMVSAAVRKKP